MAEFVKVVDIWHKMCESNKGCKSCFLNQKILSKGYDCHSFVETFPEEAEKILLKWERLYRY